MKKITHSIIIGSCALCFWHGAVISGYCQEAGAAFLKISPSARSAGMGDAFNAVADDASAIWGNPGGLATLTSQEFSGTHAEWFADMSYDFVSYIHPHRWGTFAGALTLLNSGSIESRDEAGTKGSDFAARDMAFTGAYACNLPYHINMGFSLKYIEQSIASHKAKGYAFDMGCKYALFSKTYLGLGVCNMGPSMRFIDESYSLPLSYSFGVGSYFGGLLIASSVQRDHISGRMSFTCGTEYMVLNHLALRMGYLRSQHHASYIDRDIERALIPISSIRGGFGVNLFGQQMDYAFVPFGELGSTHRISFSSKF